jgi:cAMP phosphodiesterase
MAANMRRKDTLTILLNESEEVSVDGVLEQQVVKLLVCPGDLHGDNALVAEFGEHESFVVYFFKLLHLKYTSAKMSNLNS